MADDAKSGLNAFGAYGVIALCGGAASVLIAFTAFYKLGQITDGGMAAIAGMVLAPGVMAIGMSYFVYRTAARIPRE